MRHCGMKGVVTIEVRVKGLPLRDEALVIARARDGAEHEERRLLHLQFVGEEAQILADAFGRVVWKPDNVGGMGDDSSGVPGRRELPKGVERILALPGG